MCWRIDGLIGISSPLEQAFFFLSLRDPSTRSGYQWHLVLTTGGSQINPVLACVAVLCSSDCMCSSFGNTDIIQSATAYASKSTSQLWPPCALASRVWAIAKWLTKPNIINSKLSKNGVFQSMDCIHDRAERHLSPCFLFWLLSSL